MAAAYIAVTVTVEEGGVFLFEAECIAEIDYELDGNQLYDFSIVDFRFEKTEDRWNGEVFSRVVVEAVRCPRDLREILYRCADYAFIEEQLIELLTIWGCIKPASAELRADHHASVI